MNFSFVHFAVAALYYHLFIQMCLATSGTRTLYVGWTLDKAMAATYDTYLLSALQHISHTGLFSVDGVTIQ